MDIERLPPNSREAEEAVLSCVFIDSASIHEVPFLKGDMFFSAGNGQVFDTMREMVTEGVPPDAITLPERLARAGLEFELSDVLNLMNSDGSVWRIAGYAESIRDAYTRREMIKAAGEIANAAYSDSNTLLEARKTATSALLDITMVDSTYGDESSKKVASNALDAVLERHAAGGKMQGLSAGYDGIDTVVRGIQGARLYLLGARPGMGKTALATNMAEKIAATGKRVLFFSLEMTAEQLMFRMAAQLSACSYDDVSEGRLTSEELIRVTNALGQLSEMSIVVVNSVRTPGQMYSKIMREKATGGVDFVIVDYLQLMSADKPYGTRTLEVGAISRALKEMAMSLNIPVMALVQLNRALENRQNRRAQLTDLRDSGELEQDADVVMFIYRDDYYLDEDEVEQPGLTELDVAKNRFGRTDVVRLHFKAEHGQFLDNISISL